MRRVVSQGEPLYHKAALRDQTSVGVPSSCNSLLTELAQVVSLSTAGSAGSHKRLSSLARMDGQRLTKLVAVAL